MIARFGPDELDRIAHQIVDVHLGLPGRLAPHETLQPVHDFAGAQRFGGDTLHDVSDLFRYALLLEAPYASVGEVRDRRQRLVDLVCQTGGHLPDDAQAVQVGELALPLLRFLFAQLAVVDVGQGSDEAHRRSVGGANRSAARRNPTERTVGPPDPMLALEEAGSSRHEIRPRPLHGARILEMHAHAELLHGGRRVRRYADHLAQPR